MGNKTYRHRWIDGDTYTITENGDDMAPEDIASDMNRLQAENARLREALILADVIAADLGLMMQFDACANDPRETWPNCNCEGCSYCAASYGMDAYKKARVHETAANKEITHLQADLKRCQEINREDNVIATANYNKILSENDRLRETVAQLTSELADAKDFGELEF